MGGLMAARALSCRCERVTIFERDVLPEGDTVRNGVPQSAHAHGLLASGYRVMDEYFPGMRRARRIVDIPWAIATGEDLRFPKVEGRRPPGFHVINRYLERVHAVASEDPVVCRKFFDVLNLLASPASLLSPPLVWRVLARTAPTDESSPWGTRRPRSHAGMSTM